MVAVGQVRLQFGAVVLASVSICVRCSVPAVPAVADVQSVLVFAALVLASQMPVGLCEVAYYVLES